ncbi:MAG: cytochrome c oxidase assembly protein subunit 15, partial [Candidatus Marinamargulisbacteria bacterium]
MESENHNINMTNTEKRNITAWLGTLSIMILVMIVIGGITRLTHSGLSMVQWKPIMGSLPPLSTEAWEKAFSLYKQFPEFKIHNTLMTLSGFKKIFFWEYFHRLWGRLIGLVLILPFFFFLARKTITKSLTLKLLALLALGGLQGFAGWYMVKSGLSDNPEVSHFRLATHLNLALTALSYTGWIIIDLNGNKIPKIKRLNTKGIRFSIAAIIGMLGIQITYGAFVAGLKAGFFLNTFPKMGADWIPEMAFSTQPFWLNFFTNPFMIQFCHRWLGFAILVLAVG